MELDRTRALAEEVLAAWTSQDVARVLACYTPDLVYSDPNTQGPVRGRAAMARYLERLFAAWSMTWTLREARPLEGGAGASVLWRGTFCRASGGDTATIDGMDLVVLEGDLIARNDVVFDRSLLPAGAPSPRGETADAVQALLRRSWMTHDAMWLRAAVEQVGVEQANRLNLRAVHDAAAFEVRRLLPMLGMTRVASLDDLGRFLAGARALLVGDLLVGDWTLTPPGTMRFTVRDCFAEKGVVRLGIKDRYACGITERVFGWLDALGLRYEVSPATRQCTAGPDGSCAWVLTFAGLADGVERASAPS